MIPPNRWLALAADRRAPSIVIASFCVIAPLQNVYLSGFTGQPGPLWKVSIYEASSGIVLLALATFVAWTSSRFPVLSLSARSVAAHIIASVIFSAVHVAAMVATRKGVFALLGDRYTFGPPLRGFAYEYGKDAFTYATMLAAFAIGRWARYSLSRRAELQDIHASGGITVKTSRGNVFVPFPAINHVEAGGNYVTLFTLSGEFLHRATLKEIEGLLPSSDFARSHRSHLVRVTAIRSIVTGSDGERTLELLGSQRVPLSRTYAAARDWTLRLRTPSEVNAPPAA